MKHSLALSVLEALKTSRRGVPRGSFLVDADALRKARQGVPTGEFHA